MAWFSFYYALLALFLLSAAVAQTSDSNADCEISTSNAQNQKICLSDNRERKYSYPFLKLHLMTVQRRCILGISATAWEIQALSMSRNSMQHCTKIT